MMSDNPTSTLKIVLAGPDHVGKSSLINRYGQDKVAQAHSVSPEVEMSLVTPGQGEPPVTFWAITGQNRSFRFQDEFFAGCHALALVYDVSAPGTFFDLMFLREEAESMAMGVPTIVIGNKIDQRVIVPVEEARGWADSLAMGFAHTSALTGEGVTETFSTLVALARQEYLRQAVHQADEH